MSERNSHGWSDIPENENYTILASHSEHIPQGWPAVCTYSLENKSKRGGGGGRGRGWGGGGREGGH